MTKKLDATHVGIFHDICKTVSTKTKVAFTLGEVLITLAIIGVIAAVTIPMLINNYQKKATVIKLRKTINILNQALKLSEVDNGDYAIWQTPSNYNMNEYINIYWLPYLNIEKVCNQPSDCGYKTNYWKYINRIYSHGYTIFESSNHPIKLNNGTLVKFYVETYSSKNLLVFKIDLNGGSAPNVIGRDVFFLAMLDKGYIGTYPATSERNGATYIKRYCGKSYDYSGSFCARKIEVDNWQIEDDYPW